MSEKKEIPKPTIPKPTIHKTPAVKPPVTMADVEPTEEPEAPEVENEEAPSPASDGVETNLVKRFGGAFIDGIVAYVIGIIVGFITGSPYLQWTVTGFIFLIKDSLPFLDGQSPGKKVMKTKAVKEDGSSLSGDWITGAIRNILFAFPPVGVIECYVLLTRSGNPGDGLRLGDQWAKTKVISLD